MVELPERPRLAQGARLQFDKTRDAWVLLSPERVMMLEGPAADILQRCDGVRTVDQIIDELASIYTADRAEIAPDVRDMLTDAADKGLVRA